jgi:hypothetical protein
MVVAYTGNGAYCFTNALHMALLASGADPLALPEPWFVESLTAMPWGRAFLPDGPHFWINAPGWSLERDALPQAVAALGWTCRTAHSDAPDEAIERLRAALAHGPAVLGPVDFGYLTHHRGSAGMAGFDHYVTALELTDGELLLHDPAGAPYAVLPVADLLDAWRAERIGWKLGPFTIRSYFVQERSPTRAEMIARAMPAVRANARGGVPGSDRVVGPAAVRHLAAAVRDGPPEALERRLVVFLLPTVTRRSVDGARFLAEAGMPAAATAMGAAAALWGRSSSAVARREWARAADLLDRVADAEHALAAAL